MAKTTKQSEKIRQQALSQLRKTREKLLREHPLLMKKLAMLAKRHMPDVQEAKGELPSMKPPPAQQEIPIDKQKNIRAILKYMESKDEGSAASTAIKAMLIRNQKRQ